FVCTEGGSTSNINARSARQEGGRIDLNAALRYDLVVVGGTRVRIECVPFDVCGQRSAIDLKRTAGRPHVIRNPPPRWRGVRWLRASKNGRSQASLSSA